MHKEILSERQMELLPLAGRFSREYFLAGGTAIALHIGHRGSIDFDLFKSGPLNHRKIITKIKEAGYQLIIERRVTEQLNVSVNGVMFTFLDYPFRIQAKNKVLNSLRIPDLLDLAAMKAYALGRRSKWKDYVDFYFILKNYFTVEQISAKANEIFDQLYSEKLFRVQLSYFDDIDFSEGIDYILPPVPENEIKDFLIEISIDIGI